MTNKSLIYIDLFAIIRLPSMKREYPLTFTGDTRMKPFIDSNEATIHHAIESSDCDSYRMMVTALADLVEAVRDGDSTMILATARELAETFEGTMHDEAFIATWGERPELMIRPELMAQA